MKRIKPTVTRDKKLTVGFFFAVILLGAFFLPYAFSAAEPARILLLGAAACRVGCLGQEVPERAGQLVRRLRLRLSKA